MDVALNYLARQPAVTLAVLAAIVITGYLVWSVLFNLFFHPLSSYPGPKLWSISQLPGALMVVSGEAGKRSLELHRKYGPVVRIGPNQLNYSHPDAWLQIAGHRKGSTGVNEKDERTFGTFRDTIIGSTRSNHTRYRKKLAAGFSPQAMRAQEPLIMKYVDLLVRRIREYGNDGQDSLDMTAWYNWITFDIIGDLSFGESFGGLETATYHPWISMLFEALKMVAFSAEVRRWPMLQLVLEFFIPEKSRRKAQEHYLLTAQKVKQRLELDEDRSDFMNAMTAQKDPKDTMSLSEINANASVLVTAGSETTATGLAAITYYLCTHPNVLSTLEKEIRSNFNSEDEINLESVVKLEYELTVIKESLRLFPPAPANAIRVINEAGDTILGRYLPPGTEVSVSYWATFRDPAHWVDSESFIPERWLGDPRYDGDAKSAYFPFSVGPRTCLGMNLAYAEMRLIIAKIIWNFEMRLAEESKHWAQQTKHYFNWEKGPLKVYFTPRKQVDIEATNHNELPRPGN